MVLTNHHSLLAIISFSDVPVLLYTLYHPPAALRRFCEKTGGLVSLDGEGDADVVVDVSQNLIEIENSKQRQHYLPSKCRAQSYQINATGLAICLLYPTPKPSFNIPLHQSS